MSTGDQPMYLMYCMTSPAADCANLLIVPALRTLSTGDQPMYLMYCMTSSPAADYANFLIVPAL